jgi:hypothetical protein
LTWSSTLGPASAKAVLNARRPLPGAREASQAAGGRHSRDEGMLVLDCRLDAAQVYV